MKWNASFWIWGTEVFCCCIGSLGIRIPKVLQPGAFAEPEERKAAPTMGIGIVAVMSAKVVAWRRVTPLEHSDPTQPHICARYFWVSPHSRLQS